MKERKKKLSLSIKILIGFLLGVVIGLIMKMSMGEAAIPFVKTYVSPFGTLFLNLIKMICFPLVFCSLVMGASSAGDVKSMGRIGGRTLVYFIGTTIIAGALSLIGSNLFRLGKSMNIAVDGLTYSVDEAGSFVDTLLNIIPVNAFAALSDGAMLQIICVALFLGAGINLVGNRADNIRQFFSVLTDIMCALTSAIMKLAPIAVFAFMLNTMVNYGVDVLKQYIAIILMVYSIAIIHTVIVYFPTVAIACKYNVKKFVSAMLPSFLVAFTTMSSAAALPLTMDNCKAIGISNKVRSFVAPLGCTIHMDGTAIYETVCAVFIANVYGIDLPISAQISIIAIATISSIGCAGVPGAGLIMLGTVLASAGLPIDGIALVMGLTTILSPIVTATNVLGDATAALLVDKLEGTFGLEEEIIAEQKI